MDTPLYRLATVAAVADMNVPALKNWVHPKRNLIKLSESEGGAGKGTSRAFTLRRSIQVAVASALVKMNVESAAAIDAAYQFAYIGSGPDRLPGETFNEGWTVICIYPGGESDVKNINPKGTSAVEMFIPTGCQRSEGVIALNVTFLIERIKRQLAEIESVEP